MDMCRPAEKTWGWGLRVVHWLNAMAVLGLLATVLLCKTFLNYRTNGALIRQKLADLHVDIALEPAPAIARAIRAPMWNWHYILGFALAALLLCRLFMLVVLGEAEMTGEPGIVSAMIHGRRPDESGTAREGPPDRPV